MKNPRHQSVSEIWGCDWNGEGWIRTHGSCHFAGFRAQTLTTAMNLTSRWFGRCCPRCWCRNSAGIGISLQADLAAAPLIWQITATVGLGVAPIILSIKDFVVADQGVDLCRQLHLGLELGFPRNGVSKQRVPAF